MRLLSLPLLLLAFALAAPAPVLATGPRDCDMNGTPCETYSDPYWDKPTEPAPEGGVGGGQLPSAPTATAPARTSQVSQPAPTDTAAAVSATVPSAEPTPEASTEPPSQPAQVASSQSTPPAPENSRPPIALLLAVGMATGALLLRFAR